MDSLEWAWSGLVVRISEFKLQRWQCVDVVMCFLVAMMVELLWCWMLLETLLLSLKKHSLQGVTDKGWDWKGQTDVCYCERQRGVSFIYVYMHSYILTWNGRNSILKCITWNQPFQSLAGKWWLPCGCGIVGCGRSGRKSHTHRIQPKVRFWSVSSSCKSL